MSRKSKSKNIKKSQKPKYLKVCPVCGSKEIRWAYGLPQFWSIWECNKCGYRGVLILEKKSKLRLKSQKL